MFNFRKFSGTPEAFAQLHPYSGPGPLCPRGIYLGRNLRTGHREYFDPWWLKLEGVIDGTNCLVTGKRMFGKSSWGKTVTPRLSMVQAGQRLDGTGPEQMRIWASNRKPEGGAAEIRDVAKFLGSTVWEVRRSRSFNPFAIDMGMTEWDFMEVAVNMSEYAGSTTLVNFQPLALQIGLSKMLRQFKHLSSIEVLAATIRGLTMSDVNAYFGSTDEVILNTYKDKFAERPELEWQLKAVLNRPHNIPEHEFLHDAAIVAAYITRVYDGDFGGVFGGTGSLRDILTQPMLAIEWSGVNERARSWADAMLWKWLTVALDNNDLDLIPHINMGDEEHEVMSSLQHARFMLGFSKKIRAFHTFDIRITQFITDISEVGTEGSELRALAEGIARSFGFHVLFRQPDDDKNRNWLSSLGISDLDIEALVRLPVGCAGIKIADPSIPIRFYQHHVMPIEVPLIKSNAATERMMERYPADALDEEWASYLNFQPDLLGSRPEMMGVA